MTRAREHNDPRIILIGLNKTATRSFHQMFAASGIASVHWQDKNERHIAPAMVSNISMMRPPLAGFGDARAFSDLTYVTKRFVVEGALFFRELHTAYPDAYFILNNRPVDAWLGSRIAHAGGTMLARAMGASGSDRDEVIASWRAIHQQHHTAVRTHFEGHDRFLDFRIDRDNPQMIADFLAPDFAVDLSHWGRFNARAEASEDAA